MLSMFTAYVAFLVFSLTSTAFSDFWVGLIVQPLHVIFIMSPLMNMNFRDVFYVYRVGHTLD